MQVIKIFSVQFFAYSCHLFLISSASVRSIPFLSLHECFLGISTFLEETSRLSHSIVFCFYRAVGAITPMSDVLEE